MKSNIFRGIVLAATLSVTSFALAQTAGQDMHDAGHATKDAAVDTGHATKRVAHKTARGTKHVAHKTKRGFKKLGHKIAGDPAPQQ